MRNLYNITDDLINISKMSCKPTTKRPKTSDIIDEDKSVKWNREEVTRLQNAYDEEAKALYTAKNKRRDKLLKELYEAIRHEVGGITINDAKEIFQYVYNRYDSNWIALFDGLEEEIDLISGIVNCKYD